MRGCDLRSQLLTVASDRSGGLKARLYEYRPPSAVHRPPSDIRKKNTCQKNRNKNIGYKF